MAVPHALVIPYPAQGHVDPLMELSHRLAKLGVLVTFVHTEFRHGHVMAALPANFSGEYNGGIRLEAIPNGAAKDDDRSRFFDVIQRSMPSFLEELIVKINEREENKITYVIVDGFIGFLLNVQEKVNIPRAAVSPASAWQLLAILLNISKLLDSGFLDHRGVLPPDMEARMEILQVHTRHMKLDKDVDLEQIAAETELSTGAELAGLCREAGTVALREDLSASMVSNRHFQTARNSLTPLLTKEDIERYSSFMRNHR